MIPHIFTSKLCQHVVTFCIRELYMKMARELLYFPVQGYLRSSQASIQEMTRKIIFFCHLVIFLLERSRQKSFLMGRRDYLQNTNTLHYCNKLNQPLLFLYGVFAFLCHVQWLYSAWNTSFGWKTKTTFANNSFITPVGTRSINSKFLAL